MTPPTGGRSETAEVLIWAKTYPELSTHHVETVCTAGVRRDGRPIRLYPVPLRYLRDDRNYRLYDVIRARVAPNLLDQRPESRRVDAETIEKIGSVPTDTHEWAGRREWIDRDRHWHFGSIAALKASQAEKGTSLGLVTPGEVVDVQLRERTAAERAEFQRKWEEVTHAGQGDLFPREYRELDYPAFDVRLLWRCADFCECRSAEPHKMKVLDWGLLELGRRVGWPQARDKLGELANLTNYDFRLFMGNFKNYQNTFGVIAMWYPLRRQQKELFRARQAARIRRTRGVRQNACLGVASGQRELPDGNHEGDAQSR